MKIGDKVRTRDGIVGIVVCLPEAGEFAENYSNGWVEYLKTGILIECDELGLGYYENLSEVTVIG